MTISGSSCFALAAAALCVVVASPAHAFVPIPVGGHPGELDLNAQVGFEAGKIEPHENEASFQKARDFREYKIGAGYTWGHYGPLQFFSTRLELTYFESPAEENDPDKWVVGPEGSSPPGSFGPECTAGAVSISDTVCRFHSSDTGAIATATISFAAIHEPEFALGFFVRGQVPFGLDKEKFANPRVDYLSGGLQLGVDLRRWLTFESFLFIGSGTRPASDDQNGAIAVTTPFHFHGNRWLLPWKVGIKLGPYVEGDIHERFDDRYDAAFSPGVLAQPGVPPERSRDRIRAARFGVTVLPYFLVTDHLAVELGYIQKLFGYDARATQFWFAGLRGLIEVGEVGGE